MDTTLDLNPETLLLKKLTALGFKSTIEQSQMESCTQVLPFVGENLPAMHRLGQQPGPDIVSAEPEITVHEAVSSSGADTDVTHVDPGFYRCFFEGTVFTWV